MRSNKLFKNILLTIACGVAYFMFTYPLHDLLAVFTATEVRPAAVLNPIMGICFGMPAAIGNAIGNLVSDIASGYNGVVLIEGVPAQIIYTYVPYLMWRKLNQGEDHIHRLDNVKRVLRLFACILTYAIISCFIVAFIVWSNYPADYFKCAYFTFLNNFTIAMTLGCPLMIIMNLIMHKKHGGDRSISLNEKLILLAAGFDIFIVVAVIIGIYKLAGNQETIDIWNNVFSFGVVGLNAFMVFSLLVMTIVEKNK